MLSISLVYLLSVSKMILAYRIFSSLLNLIYIYNLAVTLPIPPHFTNNSPVLWVPLDYWPFDHAYFDLKYFCRVI